MRERGTDFLLYTLLEAILDNYFKTLEDISKEVMNLNQINIKTDPSPSILEEVEKHKAAVLFIKTAIMPIHEFAVMNEKGTNPFIEERNLKYFYEIKDLCLSILNTCDSLNASLESTTNLFFSVQGHKMNQVMKTLTVVATIFIPLTFIAGVYGMNFINMPELHWKYGYFGILGFMFLVFVVMIVFFKRKKWF